MQSNKNVCGLCIEWLYSVYKLTSHGSVPSCSSYLFLVLPLSVNANARLLIALVRDVFPFGYPFNPLNHLTVVHQICAILLKSISIIPN